MIWVQWPVIKKLRTHLETNADQGNISIANSHYSKAVLNNYLHNFMAKEYYAKFYSAADQNTFLNQTPLRVKSIFLYPTLYFVMVLKWLFRKNTQSSPSWTVEVRSHNPWYVSWVAVLFRNCSATKPTEPMCTMRRKNYFKVKKLLFLFTFVPTIYKGQLI